LAFFQKKTILVTLASTPFFSGTSCGFASDEEGLKQTKFRQKKQSHIGKVERTQVFVTPIFCWLA
jgi:hypothetical protein